MTIDANSEGFANLTAEVRGYIKTVLHRSGTRKPCAAVRARAGSLANDYAIEVMDIAGVACALLLTFETLSPSQIAEDVARARSLLKMPVILVAPVLSSTQRSHLIERGVAFIDPGYQLYVPELAIDLRERYRPPVRLHKGGLSPVAQCVLLYCQHHPRDEVTAAQLAQEIDYTQMSIGRALGELAARGIARLEQQGREKVLNFPKPPYQTILSCQELLNRPARGIHGVKFSRRQPDMIQAGEVALSALTGVRLDALPTFAIVSAGWKPWFDAKGIEDVNDIDDADALIETWRYDPAILSGGPYVDPLSLYAQFWADPNPRISGAAEALLKETLG